MASDLLFGWVLGIMTVIIPYMLIIIYGLRRQLRLTGPHEQKAQAIGKKKGGLFGWLKKSYNHSEKA